MNGEILNICSKTKKSEIGVEAARREATHRRTFKCSSLRTQLILSFSSSYVNMKTQFLFLFSFLVWRRRRFFFKRKNWSKELTWCDQFSLSKVLSFPFRFVLLLVACEQEATGTCILLVFYCPVEQAQAATRSLVHSHDSYRVWSILSRAVCAFLLSLSLTCTHFSAFLDISIELFSRSFRLSETYVRYHEDCCLLPNIGLPSGRRFRRQTVCLRFSSGKHTHTHTLSLLLLLLLLLVFIISIV